MKEHDVMHIESGVDRDVLLRVLVASIARWTKGCEQFTTAIPGLTFYRHEEPTQLRSGLLPRHLYFIID